MKSESVTKKKKFPLAATKSVKWVFTVNSYDKYAGTRDWVDVMKAGGYPIDDDRVRYWSMAEERGKSGNLHIQGYIHFWDSQRGSLVAKLLKWSETGCHIEKARTVKAADYPGKEGKDGEVYGLWTYGDRDSLPGDNQGQTRQEKKELFIWDLEAGMDTKELWMRHCDMMLTYWRSVDARKHALR